MGVKGRDSTCSCMCPFVLAIVFQYLICFSDAGYCTQYYSCGYQHYSTYKSSTTCHIWHQFRCTKYRQKSSTNYRACSRSICCSGYTGASCSHAICFGSTSCPNRGTCVRPDYCRCPLGFTSPRCTDTNECATNNGGCTQNCINTHGSYHCTCKNGYTLEQGKICEDIDDCAQDNGGCGDLCQNTAGSFHCACKAGYFLDNNGTKCKGPPQVPLNFTIVDFNSSSIVVEWLPGHNGGDDQNFVIEYHEMNMSASWSEHNVSNSYWQFGLTSETLKDLHSNTIYEIKMYGRNVFGAGERTEVLTVQTGPSLDIEPRTSQNVQHLTGGVVGSLLAILLTVLAVAALKYRVFQKLRNKSDKTQEKQNQTISYNNMANYDEIDGDQNDHTKGMTKAVYADDSSAEMYETISFGKQSKKGKEQPGKGTKQATKGIYDDLQQKEVHGTICMNKQYDTLGEHAEQSMCDSMNKPKASSENIYTNMYI